MSIDKTKFQIGVSCLAKDFANSWYKSKIVDLDAPNSRVKVHFLGWNSRYDQWFDIESGDVKLQDENVKSETQQKLTAPNSNKKTKSDKSIKQETAPVQPPTSAPDIRYPIGTKIAAKWIDESFYPAQVLRHVMKMSILYYEVKFFDGVKKLVRFNNTRDVTEEELLIYYPPAMTENNQPNSTNETPATTSTSAKTQEAIQEENRRVEAELLLGIQQPHIIKEEASNAVDAKTSETPPTAESVESTTTKTDISNDSNLRKSSRVKRLKTFKDEIVFYSSSTIVFNNSEQDTVSSNLNSKKRKSVSDINKTDQKANEHEVKKEDKTSVLVKESASKEANNKKNLMQLRLKAFKAKDTKRSLKENLQNTQNRITKLQEKMDKKNKEEKKERIQKLIETNRMALKWQQELIEKHLRQHQHMKLKKKMLKMLRKQNKQKQQLIKQQQHQLQTQPIQSTTQVDPLDDFKYEDLIRCNFSNCDKTFRKQSLLEYHLKYHHYVDVNLFTNYDSSQNFNLPQMNSLKLPVNNKKSNKTNVTIKKNETNSEKNLNDKLIDSEDLFEYDNYQDDDPYDVIHCKCGNNKSDGFMIQCEVCLCWQHRVCLQMNSDEDVPKNHYCWICSEPGNKLKKLKYQSWMQMKSLKSGETDKRKKPATPNDTNLNALKTIDDSSQHRLRLLNICSKKYYNLNLLMYTLEYQTSLLNKLLKSRADAKNSSLDETNLKDQIEKLTVNITHLQSCAMKKFDDFNAKLDELEKSQSNTEENTLPRFFNLQELYNQLQSLVYQ